MAAVVEQPLGGAEEPAPVRDAWLGEDLVVVEAERAADLEVLPVVPDAERGEEGVGVGRPESEPDACPPGRNEGDGLFDGQRPCS